MRTYRPGLLRVAAVATIPAAVVAVAVPAQAASATHLVYAGSAYGSTVDLGGLVTSGKTSLVSLCTPSNTASKTNHAAAVNLPPLGSIGAVTTSISAAQRGGKQVSSASASTGATSLLGGLVTADAITSTSTLTYDGTSYTTGGGVNLLNVSVNGQSMALSTRPNTVIQIPGVAKVVLNRQFASRDGNLHAWTVQAIYIVVLAGNPLGLPVGKVVISNATANLHEPVNSLANGGAYGTSVTAANGAFTSGRSAVTAIGCGGTDGVTKTNTTVGINVPGVGSTGVISSSSMSSDSPSSTVAHTSAHIAAVSLAGGAITASAITVDAVATRANGTTSYAGSQASFASLKVGGVPIPVNVPQNTVIAIPFVGSVTLNAVTTGSTGVQAYGLVLTLLGGTKVVLASARAQIQGH